MSETEGVIAGPPPVPRTYVGWIALALMFLLLIYGAIGRYVKVEPRQKEESYSGADLSLRLMTSMRVQADKLAGKKDQAAEAKSLRDSYVSMLNAQIAQLVSDSKTSRSAARYYTAMRFEAGDPIPADRIELLRNSLNPVDKTFAEIYAAEKLTPEKAKSLANQLPDQPYVNLLAKVHAHEKAGDTKLRGQTFDTSLTDRLKVAVGFLPIFLGLSFAAWLAFLRSRGASGLKPLGHSVGRVTLADADRLAIRAAQILGAYLALEFVAALLPAKLTLIAPGLAIVATVILLAFVPAGGKKIGFQELGLTFDNLPRKIGWGVAGFFAEVPVTVMLATMGSVAFSFLPTPTHPAEQVFANSKNLMELVPLLFFGSILAPIWEETLFRGLLFPAFGRLAGSMVSGLIISSLLFGLIHPQGPALVLALGFVGATSCFLAFQTRSLIPSIVMHMLHNAATLGVMLLLL